jgi:hypothetical protein
MEDLSVSRAIDPKPNFVFKNEYLSKIIHLLPTPLWRSRIPPILDNKFRIILIYVAIWNFVVYSDVTNVTIGSKIMEGL